MIEQSHESKLLFEFLQKAVVGRVITREELTKVSGCDTLSRPGPLATARKKLRRDPYFIVFGSVPKIGIKRLSENEITAATGGFVRRIHSTAKSGIQTSACINDDEYVKLSQKEKAALSTARAILYAARCATEKENVKALEDKSGKVNLQLSVHDTLQFMAGKQ